MADPALAAELGPGVRVIKQDRGVFDALPLSVLTTQALAGLGQLAGLDLAAQRFRPNILVDTPGPGFPEDGWVGTTLRLGGLRMRVDKPDQRCVVSPSTRSRWTATARFWPPSPASAATSSASMAPSCSPAASRSATRSSSSRDP